MTLTFTHVGGPTLVLDVAGVRVVTDPTFDPPGPYPLGKRVLTKLTGPAVDVASLGHVDPVLLSHDQHPDNLDNAGRALLAEAGRVLSTPAAATRIPGVDGLEPWQEAQVATPHGPLTITAVPARHGPPGIEPVSGTVRGRAGPGLADRLLMLPAGRPVTRPPTAADLHERHVRATGSDGGAAPAG